MDDHQDNQTQGFNPINFLIKTAFPDIYKYIDGQEKINLRALRARDRELDQFGKRLNSVDTHIATANRDLEKARKNAKAADDRNDRIREGQQVAAQAKLNVLIRKLEREKEDIRAQFDKELKDFRQGHEDSIARVRESFREENRVANISEAARTATLKEALAVLAAARAKNAEEIKTIEKTALVKSGKNKGKPGGKLSDENKEKKAKLEIEKAKLETRLAELESEHRASITANTTRRKEFLTRQLVAEKNFPDIDAKVMERYKQLDAAYAPRIEHANKQIALTHAFGPDKSYEQVKKSNVYLEKIVELEEKELGLQHKRATIFGTKPEHGKGSGEGEQSPNKLKKVLGEVTSGPIGKLLIGTALVAAIAAVAGNEAQNATTGTHASDKVHWYQNIFGKTASTKAREAADQAGIENWKKQHPDGGTPFVDPNQPNNKFTAGNFVNPNAGYGVNGGGGPGTDATPLVGGKNYDGAKGKGGSGAKGKGGSGAKGKGGSDATPLVGETGKEGAVLNMIANREGVKGDSGYDMILGDKPGQPGTSVLGAPPKPISQMSLKEVYDWQTQMLSNPKNKWNSSAVGSGQFVRSTLFGKDGKSGIVGELGIKPEDFDKVKFDKTLQRKVTLKNFSDTVGNPNADPSTWDKTALGNQWESFDTRKGKAELSQGEIDSVKGASADRITSNVKKDAIPVNQANDPTSKMMSIINKGDYDLEQRKDIQQYLETGGHGMDPSKTSWCAAAIGSALEQGGYKSIPADKGGNIANSYQTWGEGVDLNKGGVQRNDVVVTTRGLAAGSLGGHLSLATGKSRMTKNGQEIEVNEGDVRDKKVNGRWYHGAQTDWEAVRPDLMVRRGRAGIEAPAIPQTDIPSADNQNTFGPNLVTDQNPNTGNDLKAASENDDVSRSTPPASKADVNVQNSGGDKDSDNSDKPKEEKLGPVAPADHLLEKYFKGIYST